ncbi:hypothetical protein [Cellulomonas sp. P5_C5]
MPLPDGVQASVVPVDGAVSTRGTDTGTPAGATVATPFALTSPAVADAVTEWWCYPVATYVASPFQRTVFGAISSTGTILACELTHGTGITRRYEVAAAGVDDHNAPALVLAAGRRPLIAWTNHDGDALLRFKVGARSGDLASLVNAPEVTFDATRPTSYTQIHHIAHLSSAASDVYWVFFRYSSTSWSFLPVTVTHATGALAFGTRRGIFTTPGKKCYAITAPGHVAAGGNQVIRVAFGFNPDAVSNAVRVFDIDVVTGAITSDQNPGMVATMAGTGANFPLTEALAPLLPDTGPATERRLFYVRPGPDLPAVAYAEWPAGAADSATYYVIEKVGGSWRPRVSLGPAGPRVGYTAAANYLAGLAFENPSQDGVVIRATSLAGVDRVDRLWPVGGGGYSADAVLTQATTEGRLVRPYAPLNGGPVRVGAVNMTSYGATGFTEFAGIMRSL